MPIERTTEPITEDDRTLERVLDDAFLPALLPALAQATGNLGLLRPDLRPTGARPPVPQGGMPPDRQTEARALALEALKTLRDVPIVRPAHPDDEELRCITTWMAGTVVPEEYLPLLLEELAPPGEDPRAPAWRYDPAMPFHVVVIGAGMSGILAAIRLRQAAIPFVVLEKNADVGGTWFENTYPGARVDVSNAFYSYSFAQRVDWPKHFSPQQVLLDYFRACADEYGVRDQIRCNTEALAAEFDDEYLHWTLRVRNAAGQEETLSANAIICAVGQLNRPNLPPIAGRERFAGPSFHSARWDHAVELAGKRVAVIGTGASAAQFVPVIAPKVSELTVFQRTPPWFSSVPHYHDDVPDGLRWLYTHVPNYVHWYRFWLFWSTSEGLLPAARVDEAWQPHERSMSKANDDLRALLTANLEAQFAGHPDLLEKCLPTYPPAAKRTILDNGAWPTALKRENVQLVSEPIREITPAGVVTEDGHEYLADVLIYGTGFQASRFLMPMAITGRNGVDLHAQWGGDARAYLGITVPSFPNLFLLYGPNTNIVVNGSIIYFSECEVQYMMGCLHLLQESGHQAMDCRRDVHDGYNREIDERNRLMVWGAATVNSWYKNELGRVAQNWPGNLLEYWQQTRVPRLQDYEFLDWVPVPA